MLDYRRNHARTKEYGLREGRGKGAVRVLVLAGASLTALAVSAPADAACSVTGSTATCTDTDTAGVMVSGPTAEIVSTAGVSTVNDAPAGVSGALYALSVNGNPDSDHASIDSIGDVSTRGTNVSAIMAGAINAQDNATGRVRIDSEGSITTSGDGANGIWGFSRGPAASVRSVGNVTTGGVGANGVIASSLGETILRSTGNVRTAGDLSNGLVGMGANVTIEATGSIETGGDGARGILVGMFATVDGETVLTGGIDRDATVSVDSISTDGVRSHGIDVASTGGAIAIDARTIEATGAGSDGIRAQVGAGGATIDIGSITSGGSGVALFANNSPIGQAMINVAGDITAGANGIDITTESDGFTLSSLWTTIDVAEGASVTGQTAIGLSATHNNGATPPPQLLSGLVTITNEGTLTGTGGTALALGQTIGTVINRGRIEGDVVIGTGTVENRGGMIDGSVTLNTSPGGAVSMFAYEGDSTGVTGTITGSAGIDNFAQIFSSDGTAIIGGGLPTAFERYGVVTDLVDAGVTVTIEAAANPVGPTPALFLMGTGSIVNRADLAGSVIPASDSAPLQIIPALASYGFVTADRGPFGLGYAFDGSGALGPQWFTNEAEIAGQILLSTAEFVNDGTITRSSAGSPSMITALNGMAFAFNNTGTIGMIDQGNRVRTDLPGSPFNDVNPYFLPEPAMTIRSAVSGTLDEAGIYVPAMISNSGTIEGGLLARMTASEFTFDNSGTITGFNGQSRNEIGLTILLGRNHDSAVGDQTWFDPAPTRPSEAATITNSGEIADSFEAHLIADVVNFTNSGTIAGNALRPTALSVEQSLENDTDAASFSFVNAGEIAGNVALELETSTVSIKNDGSITGAGYSLDQDTIWNVLFGGEAALEIDNATAGDNSLTFVNTGNIVTTAHASSGVTIEGDAGGDSPGGADAPLTGDLAIAVVNSGTISATGGATLVTPQSATWLASDQLLVNPLAALAVDGTEVTGESTIAIENQEGGVIRAGGSLQIATAGGYVPASNAPEDLYTTAVYAAGKAITITNAGTIEGGAGSTLMPHMIMEDLTFHETFLAGAIQTAGGEYEVGDGETYIASIDHVTNTATGVIVGSINLGGNDDVLHNAGRIEGAVHLGSGDDVLELAESSIIDGLVDLGDGDDLVALAFTEAAASETGQVASTVNAERLLAQSGSWRADGTRSEYDLVTIAEGATLIVAGNEDGELAIDTGLVELDGALHLDLAVDGTEGDLGEITIAGKGSLHLVGTATIELTDATGLKHTGGIFVENGELLLTTVYGGDITTSGDGVFQLAEDGDFTGNLVNDGTFVFSRIDDYSFLGDFTGSGLLEKRGDGVLTFAGLYGFEGTTLVNGGSVAFTGQLSEDAELDLSEGTVDLSRVEGGQQTIAQLSGTGGAMQLGGTQLTVAQTGNSVFSGSLTGTGGLIKEGDGDLKLNGDGTGFTGTGQVDGGRLSVNGDFSNASFIVNGGGTLGGAGILGDVSVNGGTLAPGNSIDTLTVDGDVTFTAASIYEVEVDAAGNADLLQVTGTASLGGAAVEVIAESGTYRPLTDYKILTAEGGVQGTFGSVAANLAFLDPSLSYSADTVTLRLVRNDIDFAAFASTPNQAAIGNLIESFGYGNALYDETLTLVDRDVAVSFASLTGEIYPAYGAALIETAEILRRQTATAAGAGDGAYAWATGLYGQVDGGKGAGSIELNGHGAAGGLGFGAGGFSASAGLGILDQGGGGQFSDGEVTFAIGRVAYAGAGGLSVGAGVQFGWVDGQIRRQTALGSISQTATGKVDGDYLQLFGDIAYRIPAGGGLTAEPFIGVSHVSLDLDAVSENGAPTALAVSAIDRDVTFADIGLRLSGEAGEGLRPFASAAYRHAWGDRASLAAVGFAGTAGTALMSALPIAKSAAELSGGLVVTRGAIDFELGYDGTVSKGFDSHGIKAGLRVRF